MNYVEQFSGKLKAEFAKLVGQKKQITHEVESYFSPEHHLFAAPFWKNFALPPANYLAANALINANLGHITDKIFNPDVEIVRPSFNESLNRMNPEFNKFFANLGSDGLSPLAFPIESLFIVLSKLQWNSKLKTAKIRKIAQTCSILSKLPNPEFFESQEETQGVNKAQKLTNLENISKIYLELFQDFKSTRD